MNNGDMNNGDMPANPLSGDAYQDFANHDESSNTSYNPECQGMTKREKLAGAAMRALIPVFWEDVRDYESADELIKSLMEASVEHADALLKELDK